MFINIQRLKRKELIIFGFVGEDGDVLLFLWCE